MPMCKVVSKDVSQNVWYTFGIPHICMYMCIKIVNTALYTCNSACVMQCKHHTYRYKYTSYR